MVRGTSFIMLILSTAVPAFGQFVFLDPQGSTDVLFGESLLVEVKFNPEGLIENVIAADIILGVDVGAALDGSLDCTEALVDVTREDFLLADTCGQCAAACGPPHGSGLISFQDGNDVDFVAYLVTFEFTCSNDAKGDFTVEFTSNVAPTVIAGINPSFELSHSDNPEAFIDLTITCIPPPQGRCCDVVQCLNSDCAAASSAEQTSDDQCTACGGRWTLGLSCADTCPCFANFDCFDGDPCTQDICLANDTCDNPPTQFSLDCDDQTNLPCALFECQDQAGAVCVDLSAPFNGDACTDNNSCTDGDQCLDGNCVGTTIEGRSCTQDQDCDNVAEGIPADAGTCLAMVCACPKATLTPTVIGGIGSRYVRIDPDLSGIDAVALRVECNGVIEWVELTPALTDFDDGPQGLANVGVGRSSCDNSYFLTPNAWTTNGANPLYVTGLSVAPGSRPTVYAVSGDCTTALDSDPAQPTLATWVFGDSNGDGQVTFVADLFRQFSNVVGLGGPGFLGPAPGTEVDTQGNSPSVPDQQITGFFDVFKCFQATTAGGSAMWTGQACP